MGQLVTFSWPRCPFPGPPYPGPPRAPPAVLHVCARLSRAGACSGTPDALLPRDFRGGDARKFSCHTGLTLEPGRRVLRGPMPALLTPQGTLAVLPPFAGRTPLQLPALTLSPRVAWESQSTALVTITANNSKSQHILRAYTWPGPR